MREKTEAKAIFDELYKNIQGNVISFEERERLQVIHNKNFAYGEVTFSTMVEILEKVQPEENEIFYDLGSGTGKSVIAASLLGNFSQCIGIEYLPGLHQVAEEVLQALEKMIPKKQKNVQFIQGDLSQIDWSEADIIYIGATCFDDNLWNNIVEKTSLLKEGCRIIVTTQHIYSKGFEMIYDEAHQMSWGMNSLRIYRKEKKESHQKEKESLKNTEMASLALATSS